MFSDRVAETCEDCNQKGFLRELFFAIEDDNVMMLCKFYDRGLCDTIEEYEKLNLQYIESLAYGSWMDGAR